MMQHTATVTTQAKFVGQRSAPASKSADATISSILPVMPHLHQFRALDASLSIAACVNYILRGGSSPWVRGQASRVGGQHGVRG